MLDNSNALNFIANHLESSDFCRIQLFKVVEHYFVLKFNRFIGFEFRRPRIFRILKNLEVVSVSKHYRLEVGAARHSEFWSV